MYALLKFLLESLLQLRFWTFLTAFPCFSQVLMTLFMCYHHLTCLTVCDSARFYLSLFLLWGHKGHTNTKQNISFSYCRFFKDFLATSNFLFFLPKINIWEVCVMLSPVPELSDSFVFVLWSTSNFSSLMDLLLVKAFIINNKSQTCLYVTTEKFLSCYFYMAIKHKLLFTALSVFVVH